MVVEEGVWVVMEFRKGYGRVYRIGFVFVFGDIIVIFDVDCIYLGEEVFGLVCKFVEEDLKFIICDRFCCVEDGVMFGLYGFGNWGLLAIA